MKRLCVIVLLLSCLPLAAHDFKMAIYEIYQSEEGYHLTIRFDIEDLEKSVRAEYEVAPGQWQSKIQEYIRKHFYLKFNGEIALIRFGDISTDQDFLTLQATLGGITGPIKTIDAFSTCLINEVPDHTNLVQVAFHGKKRYFRLSEDRIKTLIEY